MPGGTHECGARETVAIATELAPVTPDALVGKSSAINAERVVLPAP